MQQHMPRLLYWLSFPAARWGACEAVGGRPCGRGNIIQTGIRFWVLTFWVLTLADRRSRVGAWVPGLEYPLMALARVASVVRSTIHDILDHDILDHGILDHDILGCIPPGCHRGELGTNKLACGAMQQFVGCNSLWV